MSRVFIFERTKQRVDGVLKFGVLTYIFDEHAQRASIFSTQDLSGDVIDSLELQRFDPERDYIAVTGHFVPVAVMLAAVGAFYGKFKALLFDGVALSYVERVLGLSATSDENATEVNSDVTGT